MIRLTIVSIIVLLSHNPMFAVSDYSKQLSLKVGTITATHDGNPRNNQINHTLTGLDWLSYIKKDLGFYLCYRNAFDNAGSKRIRYNVLQTGFRYYPITMGMPIYTRKGTYQMTYTSSFMPFISIGGSLGRYVFQVFSDPTYVGSSDVYGFHFSMGGIYTFLDGYTVELEFQYEQAKNFGLPKLNGTAVNALYGMGKYF